MKHSIFLCTIALILFSCGNPIPRKPIVRKTYSTMEASVSFNKSLIAEEEGEFKAIMELDSLSTYYTSPNGFWYKFNHRSQHSYSPKFGDQVTYTYEVYTVTNNLIYSFEEIGEQQYMVDQQEIIEGLRNGLKLMGEGDIVTFLFPSHKVYGYLGDQKKININQPLIYKVQLNKIIKK